MTIEELAQIVAGNARAIQALGNEVAEFKRIVAADHEQSQAERQALARDVAQLVATQEQNSRELNQAMIRLADTQGESHQDLFSTKSTLFKDLLRVYGLADVT